MKFFKTIVKGNEPSIEIEKELINKLKKEGFIYRETNPDLVISIGGDGTFLRTVQDFVDEDPLYITINKGNLGYLCEYEANELDLIIKDLKNPTIKKISLLEGHFLDNIFFALNEIRVESLRGNSFKLDVAINGTFLESIRGDGCLVSTSIGSSGLAKSLGGSLVDNEIEMIEFVEKAPIENRTYKSIRTPFVLAKDKIIQISNISDDFSIIYDCKYIEHSQTNEPITIKLSDKKIRVLKNENSNYILKTRRTFLP